MPVIFRRVRKIAKKTINFVVSVCPSFCLRGITRLPMGVFSWNFIFQYFSDICLENSRFVKIWQEYRILYMKTNIYFYHIWPSSSQNRKCFKQICRVNQNTFCVQWSFFGSVFSCEMWKNIIGPDRPQMSVAHAYCMLDNWGYRHTLRICNRSTYCFSTATIVRRKRLNVTLHANCLSCYNLMSQLLRCMMIATSQHGILFSK